jgi:hypothetical protein
VEQAIDLVKDAVDDLVEIEGFGEDLGDAVDELELGVMAGAGGVVAADGEGARVHQDGCPGATRVSSDRSRIIVELFLAARRCRIAQL